MKINNINILIITFIIYSVVGVFTKLASMQEFLSIAYIVYFSVLITTLGIYAILWQKVLSFMPLNKAFLFKSITLILGLLVAHFVFSEAITINNIVGAMFIMAGIVVLSCKQSPTSI